MSPALTEQAPPREAPACFWFLSYVMTPNASSSMSGHTPSVCNILLAGIHPLIWLSSPPETYRKYFTSFALAFHEVDEATFEKAKSLNYIETTDVRGVPS